MIAFDSDVLSLILGGAPAFVARAKKIPTEEHAMPIVVVEEILRDRLNFVRRPNEL